MKRLCLVNGKHTPGSEWERECPLRAGGFLDQRRLAARASAEARQGRATAARKGLSVGDPSSASSANGGA